MTKSVTEVVFYPRSFFSYVWVGQPHPQDQEALKMGSWDPHSPNHAFLVNFHKTKVADPSPQFSGDGLSAGLAQVAIGPSKLNLRIWAVVSCPIGLKFCMEAGFQPRSVVS